MNDRYSLSDERVALLRRLEDYLAVSTGSGWRRWLERPLPRVIANANWALNTIRGGGACWDVQTTPFFGLPMRLQLPEIVSERIYSNGFFEAELSRALIICLSPGSVFYDVGAHLGYFTLLAASIVGADGKVTAFEPTPRSFRILTSNSSRLSQIALENVAVYSSATTLTFKDYGPGLSAFNTFGEMKLDRAYREKLIRQEEQIEVKTCVLDRYCETSGRPPDFVKIDAESSELEVLDGMRLILRQHRPVVSIEMGDVDGDNASSRILDFMSEYDYAAFEFTKAGQLKEHRRRNKYRYDNFLFVPKEESSATVAAFQQYALREQS